MWTGRVWQPDRERFRRWLRDDVTERAHGGPVAIAFWLLLDGKPVDTYPEEGCKLRLKSATPKLVSGVYDCSAAKGKTPLGKVEFSAQP